MATSKHVLFLGNKNLLATGTDDHSLACTQATSNVLGGQHRWLAGGYDLEIGHVKKWLAWRLPGG